jgi:hypothetical protein
MMVMATPMAVMVADVVAHDRTAHAADHGADRPRNHCSADRAGDCSADGAFFSRLGGSGEAQGQHRAACHDKSTHIVLSQIQFVQNELSNSMRRVELGSGHASGKGYGPTFMNVAGTVTWSTARA